MISKEANNVLTIDTAVAYGDSERVLGEAGAAHRFTLDTKLRGGFAPQGGSRRQILEEVASSKANLQTDAIDILYLHAPDSETPLEETFGAIDEVYQTGFFKRLGLSNYTAEDVQQVFDLTTARGWVAPTVYQGNYSAFARRQETVLFPTLRKLGISFRAYSPVAGGFLTKTRQQIEEGHGRFMPGAQLQSQMYINMFHKPSLLDALDEWCKIANDEGISRAGMAYRWIKFHSALKPELGDAFVIGASNLEQLEETLAALKEGPLSSSAVQRIGELWPKIEKDAPLDVLRP